MPKSMNDILRLRWTGQEQEKDCVHLDMIDPDVEPAAEVCTKCVELGEGWPELRMCLICGHVGCCDQAKNQHALRHYQETGHPLINPYKEPGMDWIWCYADEALLDPR